MRRALVIGPGGLRGAYDAGVMSVLCRELGPDYFDEIWASSVGVFASAFFLTNQLDIIEEVWRNRVDGTKLVNFFNPLRGRDVLDTEYLIDIFSNGETAFDHEAYGRSKTKLHYVLTEAISGGLSYVVPSKENIFFYMLAATAVHGVHRPVCGNSVCYRDGGIADPLPIELALLGNFDEIFVVYNKPRGFYTGKGFDLFEPLLNKLLFPPNTKRGDLKRRLARVEKTLDNNASLKIIRPTGQIPLERVLDTNKARINKTVDLGIKDAEFFLESYLS